MSWSIHFEIFRKKKFLNKNINENKQLINKTRLKKLLPRYKKKLIQNKLKPIERFIYLKLLLLAPQYYLYFPRNGYSSDRFVHGELLEVLFFYSNLEVTSCV